MGEFLEFFVFTPLGAFEWLVDRLVPLDGYLSEAERAAVSQGLASDIRAHRGEQPVRLRWAARILVGYVVFATMVTLIASEPRLLVKPSKLAETTNCDILIVTSVYVISGWLGLVFAPPRGDQAPGDSGRTRREEYLQHLRHRKSAVEDRLKRISDSILEEEQAICRELSRPETNMRLLLRSERLLNKQYDEIRQSIEEEKDALYGGPVAPSELLRRAGYILMSVALVGMALGSLWIIGRGIAVWAQA